MSISQRIAPPSRRSFIGGLIGLVAAPAIVRTCNIMPVRAVVFDHSDIDYLYTAEWSKFGRPPFRVGDIIRCGKNLLRVESTFTAGEYWLWSAQ